MSIAALDWAFRQQIENPGAKFILLTLANFTNDENFSYPSIKTLERLTNIKPRTIAEHLRFLEAEGFIKRRPRFLKNGGRASSLYEIRIGEGSPLQPPQEPPAATAGLSDTSLFETKKEELASPEKIIFPLEDLGTKPHGIWTDLKALLLIQSKDDSPPDVGAMVGKLVRNFTAERVSRIYETNRDLIFGQADAYGYLTELLKRDKVLNKNEGALQTALREARYYHNQMFAGADLTPTFKAENYVNKWPVLQKYIDEIATGKREVPKEDIEAAEKETKFNEGVLEQARFYKRV